MFDIINVILTKNLVFFLNTTFLFFLDNVVLEHPSQTIINKIEKTRILLKYIIFVYETAITNFKCVVNHFVPFITSNTWCVRISKLLNQNSYITVSLECNVNKIYDFVLHFFSYVVTKWTNTILEYSGTHLYAIYNFNL